MGVRAAAWLALLIVAGAASAAVSVQQAVATSPEAKAPPVVLLAGSGGSTSIGAGGTSATTTASLPLLGSTQVLRIQPGTGTWAVHIETVSASGFGALDSTTVTLGAPTTTQVRVSLGGLAQTTGNPVTLSQGGSNLEIRASGTVVGTGTLDLRIVMEPTAGAEPRLEYRYLLSVT